MSTVKLPFSGPTVCEDGAVSLMRVGQQRRRSWRSRLADKRRRSRKCSCRRSAPIGWLPLTGRDGRVVRCTSSGRLCIPVTGARDTAAFLPLSWRTILDDLWGETMFSRSSWFSTQFKAVLEGWICGDDYAERWRSVPTCTNAGRDLRCSVVTWSWWSRFSARSPPRSLSLHSGFHNSSEEWCSFLHSVWQFRTAYW